MSKETDYFLLMTLSEGFYGEFGGVYDVHDLGYAELCEKYSEVTQKPWFDKTHGVLFFDEQMTIIDVANNGDFVCRITTDDIGIIPNSLMSGFDRFGEALIESYNELLGIDCESDDYEHQIDLEKLKKILAQSNLVLYKPFDFCGYFEKKSTVETSKAELLQSLQD